MATNILSLRDFQPNYFSILYSTFWVPSSFSLDISNFKLQSSYFPEKTEIFDFVFFRGSSKIYTNHRFVNFRDIFHTLLYLARILAIENRINIKPRKHRETKATISLAVIPSFEFAEINIPATIATKIKTPMIILKIS